MVGMGSFSRSPLGAAAISGMRLLSGGGRLFAYGGRWGLLRTGDMRGKKRFVVRGGYRCQRLSCRNFGARLDRGRRIQRAAGCAIRNWTGRQNRWLLHVQMSNLLLDLCFELVRG